MESITKVVVQFSSHCTLLFFCDNISQNYKSSQCGDEFGIVWIYSTNKRYLNQAYQSEPTPTLTIKLPMQIYRLRRAQMMECFYKRLL